MTRLHSIIPFHDLVFHDEMPQPRAVEERLKKFLRAYRLPPGGTVTYEIRFWAP